jgi:anti-sigma regulatory factor (Ser/Thr protein kinase)
MPLSQPDDREGLELSGEIDVARSVSEFRHEALLYAGKDEFVDRSLTFIHQALAAEEPVLEMVGAAKIDALRAELDGDAEHVHFADIAQVGANPARIIPAWRDFVSRGAVPGQALRGIGEPIWTGRSPAELVECQRHESLLNVAFADASFRLLCPYDTSTLDAPVIEEACCSHPFIVENGGARQSDDYRGLGASGAPFSEPLPEPAVRPQELQFGDGPLDRLRRFVERQALAAGLTDTRTNDLVLAVNEAATNSVRHGGGAGVLRMWQEGDALISEVRDGGCIAQPLAGRERPEKGQLGGHGLWLVNQVCDLVQMRSFEDGGAVRMHMRRG